LDVERQKAPPAAKGCDLLPQLLQVKLKELQETLKKTIDVEKQYGVWKKKIADGFATATNGSQAIEAGAAAIETDRASVGVTIEQAKSAIAAMNKIMSDTAYDACAWQLAVTTQVLGVYEGKIEQLGRLAESLSALAKQLRTQFGDSNKWIGRAFIVATDLEPSTVSDVEVAVSASDLSVINENGNVSLKEDPKASTVSFLIREKVGWTVESSVGATFAQLTRPKYGTSTNAAGETIVQKAKDERALITPSVMVNITPQNKSGVVPIFQFGVSIATSAPALLIGGGWKIPGVQSGRLAFSGGAVLGWVKDLDKLQVNDVVTGTKELEADLRFDPMPRFGWYLNIQYKFGK